MKTKTSKMTETETERQLSVVHDALADFCSDLQLAVLGQKGYEQLADYQSIREWPEELKRTLGPKVRRAIEDAFGAVAEADDVFHDKFDCC